jgi:hypothetical protein
MTTGAEGIDEPEEERVASRAASLAAEEGATVDDPEAQAEAMLTDSDEREEQASTPDRGGGFVEHRHSEDTVEPPD